MHIHIPGFMPHPTIYWHTVEYASRAQSSMQLKHYIKYILAILLNTFGHERKYITYSEHGWNLSTLWSTYNTCTTRCTEKYQRLYHGLHAVVYLQPLHTCEAMGQTVWYVRHKMVKQVTVPEPQKCDGIRDTFQWAKPWWNV